VFPLLGAILSASMNLKEGALLNNSGDRVIASPVELLLLIRVVIKTAAMTATMNNPKYK
jgi:hypothetical protein